MSAGLFLFSVRRNRLLSVRLWVLVYGYPAPVHTLTKIYGSADFRKREFSVGCTLGRNPNGGLRSLWHGLCKPRPNGYPDYRYYNHESYKRLPEQLGILP